MWYDVPGTTIIICSSLQNGEYSLLEASKNGHVEVVSMLLLAGVKPDPQQVSSSSPSPRICGDLVVGGTEF